MTGVLQQCCTDNELYIYGHVIGYGLDTISQWYKIKTWYVVFIISHLPKIYLIVQLLLPNYFALKEAIMLDGNIATIDGTIHFQHEHNGWTLFALPFCVEWIGFEYHNNFFKYMNFSDFYMY